MSAIFTLLCLIAGFLTHTVHAEEDRFAGVTIVTTKVNGNISMLVGAGGNIGVSAGPDGVLMVDDQYAPLSEKIAQALDDLGSDKPRFIINTHFHGDHTGGNDVFSKSGTIIAHENVRVRLLGEDKPPSSLPIITFDQQIKTYFNGEEIRIIHVPAGHTDGDSIVLFKNSNVAHLGDQFWNGLFPFVDIENGGTVQGYTSNVASSLTLIADDTRIIPGHGPLGSKADLERFLTMLQTTTKLVTGQMRQGQSLESIKQNGLGTEWKTWGEWFITEERWIETIHTSFSNSPVTDDQGQ
jgi:glyoxylase-like metal-dependent hydrolase (beta-lactamase superfamily II)